MTAQAADKLYYKTEVYYLATEPLATYLAKFKIDINKISNKGSTGCWRGYIGSWIIEDDKLYLIGLCDAWGGNDISIETLFPGEKKIFAEWFSGEIRTPCGELKMYIHMGYSSLYEKDMFFNFKNGILLSIREVDNSELYKQILEEKELGLKKRQELEQEKQKGGFVYRLKKLLKIKKDETFCEIYSSCL